ncbi:MAG: hypothetical protein LQ340_000491 [Diploschistes diacapsis]|nr:MAG: hypothetical protein LQ340_000491 [Diploschistes diacapsis]
MDPAQLYDSEILPTITAMAAQMPSNPMPVHDTASRRVGTDFVMQLIATRTPSRTDVASKDYHTTTADGHSLLLRWTHSTASPPHPSRPGPAALYVHGGGMIAGSVALTACLVETHVSLSGVPMLSVEYRLAPEHPHPTPVNDAYAGLLWLHAHASELGVDPARVAIIGESAGGGIAAGTALLARDKGLSPGLALQILVYPMLDDRTRQSLPEHEPFYLWNSMDNVTGWSALLGFDVSGPQAEAREVEAYAAPARAKSLKGLPRALIDVGTLDLFVGEDVEYAARLLREGVPVELHVRPGVPHAFDWLVPEIGASKRAFEDRVRVLRSL